MIQKQKGCNDIYGREAKVWKYVESVIDAAMEKYNYTFMRTPIFEATELFHRGIGEGTDIVSKETYDFVDRGGRNITLRPEGTAGVVRSYIENKMYGDPNQPVKVYYNGTMYRYERPQSGRDRELTQFGMEVLGSDDPLTDAEVISLAVNIYKMLGLKEIKVNINSLGDNESRRAYRDALVEYFTPHIKDLCEDCQVRLEKNPLRILDCKVDAGNEILANAPKTIDYLNEASAKRFEEVKDYLDIMQIKYEIDPNIVRGLDYYNRTVFEIKSNNLGSQNAVCGGGRYDSLVKNLGGEDTPAIGFAMGMERLASLLGEKPDNKLDGFIVSNNPLEAIKLTEELRTQGITCEFDLTNKKFVKQLEKASKVARYALILGEDELAQGKVTVKNLETSEQKLVAREDIKNSI
jgi:histidyl-tRNA synthetase